MVLAALFFLSCQDQGVTVNINVTPKTVSLPAAGGQATVAVNAPMDWVASVAVDWLHVTPASGTAGNVTLTVSADPNTATEPRSAQVTLRVPSMGLSETVAVTQAAAEPVEPPVPDPELSISPESGAVTYAGGELEFTVTTNRDWTAAADAAWVTVAPASGKEGTATVKLTVAANPDVAERSATVTVTAENLTKTFAVSQEARPEAMVQISSASLLYTAEGGSYPLTVFATRDWTAATEASWVHLPLSGAEGESAIEVKADANPTYEDRSATVVFTAEDQTVILSIAQRGAEKPADPEISLSATEMAFAAEAGNATLALTSNTAWEASVGVEWIALTPVRGEAGTFDIALSVLENPSEQDRSAEIVFKAGEAQAVLSVYQMGKVVIEEPYVELSVKELTFTADAATASFSVFTNQAWSARSDASWVSVTPASGEAGNATLQLSIQANTSTEDRTAIITVTAGSLTAQLEITQQGFVPEPDPVVELSTTALAFTHEGGTSQVVVIADTAWTASDNAGWVDFTPKKGEAGTTTVSVTVNANKTTTDRSAVITFTAGKTQVTLNVSQRAQGQVGLGGITGSINGWGDGGSTEFTE